MLLEHPGEVVTREELQQRLWPADTFVDFDIGLNSAVKKLQQALHDSAESPRYVETLSRRGYRLIALSAMFRPPRQSQQWMYLCRLLRKSRPNAVPGIPSTSFSEPAAVPVQSHAVSKCCRLWVRQDVTQVGHRALDAPATPGAVLFRDPDHQIRDLGRRAPADRAVGCHCHRISWQLSDALFLLSVLFFNIFEGALHICSPQNKNFI
jgi:hypothetical protein